MRALEPAFIRMNKHRSEDREVFGLQIKFTMQFFSLKSDQKTSSRSELGQI